MNDNVVGPEQKPTPHPFYGDSWERGKDPWHADAFAGMEEKLGGNPGSTGARKGGWFLLDGFGNAIGFVPDGTPVEQPTPAVQAVIVATRSPEETP